MTAAAKIPGEAAAGRACPLDYMTPLEQFRRAADIEATTLYVVGGLYGNPFALDAIEEMAGREQNATLVFNGDAHWFDAELALFLRLEARLAPYFLMRGNVETELGREEDIGAGCGCAYPTSVDQGVVDRSNRILASLSAMLNGRNELRRQLRQRPPTLIAKVGDERVGIVHGDPHSLAGWGFDYGPLADRHRDAERRLIRDATGLSLFASTHTCTAVLRRYDYAGGAMTIANNGGGGLPNFAGDRRGLITRISLEPSPVASLYGTRHGGVFVEAIPVAYDHDAFLALFDRLWPQGSDASVGYRSRIVDGMMHDPARAGGGLTP